MDNSATFLARRSSPHEPYLAEPLHVVTCISRIFDLIDLKNCGMFLDIPYHWAQIVVLLCAWWIVRNLRRRQLYLQWPVFPTFSDPPGASTFASAIAISTGIIIIIVIAKPSPSSHQAHNRKPSSSLRYAAFETKPMLPPEDNAECPHQISTIPLSNT